MLLSSYRHSSTLLYIGWFKERFGFLSWVVWKVKHSELSTVKLELFSSKVHSSLALLFPASWHIGNPSWWHTAQFLLLQVCQQGFRLCSQTLILLLPPTLSLPKNTSPPSTLSSASVGGIHSSSSEPLILSENVWKIELYGPVQFPVLIFIYLFFYVTGLDFY